MNKWILIPMLITDAGLIVIFLMQRHTGKLFVAAIEAAYKRGYSDGAATGLTDASWGQVAQGDE